MPASGVRHRLLKTQTGIERKFVNKKKLKERRANVYKIMHVGLGRQLQEGESVIGEEHADATTGCSPTCGQALPGENFPEVILAGLGVRGKFKKEMPTPKDFAFHMQAL